MFAKQCRILHTSRKRKRRRRDPNCVRAPSVGIVIVVPHKVSHLHTCSFPNTQALARTHTLIVEPQPSPSIIDLSPTRNSNLCPYHVNEFDQLPHFIDVTAFCIGYNYGCIYCLQLLRWVFRRRRLLLTATVPAEKTLIDAGYDIKLLTK